MPDGLPFSAPHLDISEPPVPTDDDYEAALSEILHNVDQDLLYPLHGISEQTQQTLTALAYHKVAAVARMERAVKHTMVTNNQGEARANKFSLKEFKQAAAQERRRINDALLRRKRVAERNLILVQGGKRDPDLQHLEEVAGDAPASAQDKIFSNSNFLKSLGHLEAKRKERIWFDTHYSDFVTDWDGTADDQARPPRRIEDAFILAVHEWLQLTDTKLASSSHSNTERAIHRFADMDHRSEPRDWLTGLKWDGVERLPTFLSRAFGVVQDEYYAAVGRCWLVSAAARIMVPGCKVDTMPVLRGPQGLTKSMALEVIGGKWYGTINVSAEKTSDFIGALNGLVIAEIAELDAISGRRVESSRVKSLLSTREDRYRPPYGRTTRVFKRTAVLVGTTNEIGWHKDETGGRRFWPIECLTIDIEWLKANREQLFAEALHRYRQGEKWWDVPEDEQRRRIMEHHTSDPLEERLETWLRDQRFYRGPGSKVAAHRGDPTIDEEWSHWGTVITTSRIATCVMQLPIDRQDQRNSRRIAKAMTKLGWRTRAVRVVSSKPDDFVRGWIETRVGQPVDDKKGQLSFDIN